jgi:hypothetical protein
VQAAYVDANSGARADCNIVNSVLPAFVPSEMLTIPTIYGKAQQLATWPHKLARLGIVPTAGEYYCNLQNSFQATCPQMDKV